MIFNLRGGILLSIGKLPESLSQAMLVGTMLVGRLDVSLKETLISKALVFSMSEPRSAYFRVDAKIPNSSQQKRVFVLQAGCTHLARMSGNIDTRGDGRSPTTTTIYIYIYIYTRTYTYIYIHINTYTYMP